MNHNRIAGIQDALRQAGLDGWLFFDHHVRDPLAYDILGLAANHVTRRWYYFVPAAGDCRGLVHRIEARHLDALPGPKTAYSSWQEQRQGIEQLLSGARRIAMQFSPDCAIPYVSLVDGGTIDLIRSFGIEIVSSADLIQQFHAVLDAAQRESHFEAGRRMDRLRAAAFAQVASSLAGGPSWTEYGLQTWLREQFDREGLTTDHPPIVAVNDHASNPHFAPSAEGDRTIQPGDFLLLDMWAKLNVAGAVYYDITWTANCGPAPEERHKIFAIVSQARDAAFQLVKERLEAGSTLQGFEVDDAARGVIRAAGYASAFVHRTGHSITTDVHGTGANMDNLETHDVRRILPSTLFSVEPGIYLPEFGLRSEFNVLTSEKSAEVTGEIQRELVIL